MNHLVEMALALHQAIRFRCCLRCFLFHFRRVNSDGKAGQKKSCLLQWRQLGTEIPVIGIEHKATAASTDAHDRNHQQFFKTNTNLEGS